MVSLHFTCQELFNGSMTNATHRITIEKIVIQGCFQSLYPKLAGAFRIYRHFLEFRHPPFHEYDWFVCIYCCICVLLCSMRALSSMYVLLVSLTG